MILVLKSFKIFTQDFICSEVQFHLHLTGSISTENVVMIYTHVYHSVNRSQSHLIFPFDLFWSPISFAFDSFNIHRKCSCNALHTCLLLCKPFFLLVFVVKYPECHFVETFMHMISKNSTCNLAWMTSLRSILSNRFAGSQ